MSASPFSACTTGQRAMAAQHLDFVYWLVSKFLAAHDGAWRFRDDLEQAGMVGLVEACIRFEPKMGMALTTFAERHIFGRVRQEWHCRCQLIPAQRLGSGGSGGHAAMLTAAPGKVLDGLLASGEELAEKQLATRLYEEACRGMVQHMSPHVCNLERTAEAFLLNMTGQQSDSRAAARYGISRSRVEQLRRRGREAFEKWAGDVREEFGE